MKRFVAARGQVTIPKLLRDQLGIQPGDTLDFEVENGWLVARKVTPGDLVEAVYGIFGEYRSTDRLVGEMRGTPHVS